MNNKYFLTYLYKFKYNTKNIIKNIGLKINNSNNKLENTIKNISNNTSNIETNKTSISENKTSIETNNEKISDNKKKIETNNENILNHVKNINDLKDEFNDKNIVIVNNINDLKDEFNDKNAIVNNIKDNNNAIVNNINDLKNEFNDKNNDIADDIKEFNNKNTIIKNLKENIKKNNDNISNNKKNIDKLKDYIDEKNNDDILTPRFIMYNLYLFDIISENKRIDFKQGNNINIKIFEQDIVENFYKDSYIECTSNLYLIFSSYKNIGDFKILYKFYNKYNLIYQYTSIIAGGKNNKYSSIYQDDFFYIKFDNDYSSIKIKIYILNHIYINKTGYIYIPHESSNIFSLKIMGKIK